jgi:hypothetical protein
MRERKLAEAGYRGRHEDIKRVAALESRTPPAEVGNFYSRDEEEEPLPCLWRFRDRHCSKNHVHYSKSPQPFHFQQMLGGWRSKKWPREVS